MRLSPLSLFPLTGLLLTGISACNPAPKDYEAPPDTIVDEDGDGYSAAEGDCNDRDASIQPGSLEVCDGLDNNCDGATDEGVTEAFYADSDQDGYGAADSLSYDCSAPTGFVGNSNDCDDGDGSAYPGAPELCDGQDNDCDGDTDEGSGPTWYADNDGDGHGSPFDQTESCDAPPGYVASGGDCDDQEAAVNPDAAEVCDEVDNDCNGLVDDAPGAQTWYYDGDGDGYGNCNSSLLACTPPAGWVEVPTAADCDCNDGYLGANPGMLEVCDGTFDEDCDGQVDEAGAVGESTWYTDADGDGWGDPARPVQACEGTGLVVNGGDCDDGRAAVNPAAQESCDGLDNDCDGATDEADAVDAATWYRDADGDTYGDPAVTQDACTRPAGYVADATDCDDTDAAVYPGAPEDWYDSVDSDCDGLENPDVCDDIPEDTIVSWDSTCTYSYANAWSVVTEWATDGALAYSAGVSSTHVMVTPAVGPLQDTDGDGDVDDRDMPAIVYTTFSGNSYSAAGYLRAILGDGSGELFSARSVSSGGTTYSVSATGGVAIGDLEGDGSPDIVTLTSDYHPIAFENDGTLKWVSSVTVAYLSTVPAISDMDGDGDGEVVIGKYVLDHLGRQVVYGADCGTYVNFPADYNTDGTQELICGGVIYDLNGNRVWRASVYGARAGIGNFDSDSAPEFVQVYGGYVYLYDNNGTQLWSYASGAAGNGSPAIADFDGDGWPEIAAAFETKIVMLEHTGAVKWTENVYDTTSAGAGCSAFDFDGDGVHELVYADQSDLTIWDGSGNALYHTSDHASGTLWEYPVIADVDRDGNAEIVVASNDYLYSGWDGITVLGEEFDEWASARTVWNQHAYSITNIEDDLSLPIDPTPSWLDSNTFRANHAWSEEPDGAPDVAPVILGVCEDCSVRTLDLYVSIENTGSVFTPASLPVALYSMNGATATLLETRAVGREVHPGDRLEPLVFSVALSDIGPDGLKVVADDDGTGAGTQNECDESDNDATWNEAVCP